ncbi:hypothetical protein C5Y96_12555 [Blastopirellula marina]|uniref:Uncharacterized protein n=1 Tax=Blastopirellula marina TaxID=124 RepID=A0A2S8FG95_9BACT|nr:MULTISPECIES: ankyrin repeat domain-containing protein [Pirellulaceae]PQO31176.1 hypothetical protein C5Y96_12555 [Blastopirellula marina]RCS51570.1 ankyrin repeat domain-containing protein [Bremerella cremea]
MGSFLTNVHVQSSSIEQVTEVLQQLELRGAWVSGASGKWVTVWDSIGMTRAWDVAQHLSQQLEAPAIAFMVHDSDIFFYWLYDNGRQLNQYNSAPGYFGEDASMDEQNFQPDCDLLKRYCRDETTIEQLESILKMWTAEEAMAGIMPDYAFAEDRLRELAGHLEIATNVADVDYGDLEDEKFRELIGAQWIGKGDPADYPTSCGMETDWIPDDIDYAGIIGAEDNVDADILKFPSCPLHNAATAGDIREIEKLVSEGADIDETNRIMVVTPLAVAAMSSTPEVIRKMVELGADVGKRGPAPESGTPLMMAVSAGQLENVRTLVELGADINEVDRAGNTLLFVTVLHANKAMMELLLELGINREAKDAKGRTALQVIRDQIEGLERVIKMAGENSGGLVQMTDNLKELETLLAE